VGHGIGDGEHVKAAHARGQQRLVRVAHRRVGDEQALLLGVQSLQNFSGPISSEHLLRACGRSDAVVALRNRRR
jgi:hypothetical protein